MNARLGRPRLREPVLIVGGYGYRNVGDEAMLAGLLTRLRGARVTVVSRHPEDTETRHGVAAVGLSDAVTSLRSHRTLLIGGGSLFGDDMGTIGRLLPIYGLLAAGAGRRVVIEGIDLEPEMGRVTRRLVRSLLHAAVATTVRDRASADLAAVWSIRAAVAPDASGWMSAATADCGRRLLRDSGVNLARPVVGLALTSVNRVVAEPAEAAVRAAINALPNVEFCFFPMSRHPHVPSHDDMHLARRLRAAHPRLRVVEATPHPSVVLAAFGQLRAVVAMRYHAMLFADRVGAPLLPLPYAPKNLRWLAERGLRPMQPTAEAVLSGLRDVLARSPLEAAS